MNEKRNKKQLLSVIRDIISFVVTLLLFLNSCSRVDVLDKQITEQLAEKYGIEFAIESISVDGGGAFFVSYPVNDPTLHFDGFAESDSGIIEYDTFPGAFISREDTQMMMELLSNEFEKVYVYGKPVHGSSSRSDEIIYAGDFSTEELHKYCYIPNLFFYIFIDSSMESVVEDPGRDYDRISKCIEYIGVYIKRNMIRIYAWICIFIMWMMKN